VTKKIEFWLISSILTLGTISVSGLIDRHLTLAAPTKELKSISTSDKSTFNKLIFWFQGGEKPQQPRLKTVGKRRTRVAGSRGCGMDIVALIPRSNLGVTVASNPTFWFYLPPSDLALSSLQFTLFDLTGTEIWATQLIATSELKSGLLKVDYQGSPLTDNTYQWQFSYQQVGCSNPQVLMGNLQKEPSLKLAKNPNSRLQIYTKNGIWHDLLTELITLRQQQPTDLQLAANFKSLFFESPDISYRLPSDRDRVDLDLMEDIVKAQVINCCQVVTIK
jgi:Domain of Unknown Function (DUF928)